MQKLHKNESGAVALLMLASAMILFMCGLIMYDAGVVIRDKIDVNVAADTAAYSQASVEARSMNMIAFANVGKRTIVGIHNMYYFQYPMYAAWWAGQCSKCCCGWYCGCWTECFNCFGNLIDGSPFMELFDWISFLGNDDLEKNLEDLDDFQDDLRKYAAYWGLGESMTRGARNGANMVLGYPPPDNSTYGPLPLAHGPASESCLTPNPLASNPVTAVTLIEWAANFFDLKRRSTSSPNIASEGPAERVNILYSFLACPLMTPSKGAPFFNEASSNSGEDMLKRSNYVYAYRVAGDLDGILKDNYKIMPGEYTPPVGVTMPRGGVWSMARSEFYFPPENKPSTILLSGAHDTWMFHPGWYGKIRPLTLPNEKPPVEHTTMFNDATTLGSALALSMFNMSGNPESDFGRFTNDMIYMRTNVTPGMTGTVENHHITDGMAK